MGNGLIIFRVTGMDCSVHINLEAMGGGLKSI